MRTERDALGVLELPEDTLYGINTARALENFDLGQRPMNRNLLRAIVLVKKAAAITYRDKNLRDANIENAIITACDRVPSA